ncbi:MAG TPA: thioredoxin family protein [Terriglobales bacterium]|nr:thioredoxin family protein [Terriglobales bacterium]
MKPLTFILVLLVLTLGAGLVIAAKVGETAPDFSLVDSNGKTHKLSDYKGKVVVLEWHNQGCPYVKKHYNSGNMQQLQKEWTAKGVVWLSIISSAPGKQGFVSGQEENAFLKQMNAAPTAALLDPSGEVGKLYSAKTTPHMFVIDPKGTIAYNGAIDDKPTSDPNDLNGASNYVTAALTEVMGGKPVATPLTKPYGCTVKYAD